MTFYDQTWKQGFPEILRDGKCRSTRSPYQQKSRSSQESATNEAITTTSPASSNPSVVPEHSVVAMSVESSVKLPNVDLDKIQPQPIVGSDGALPSSTLPPAIVEFSERPPSPRSQIRGFQKENQRTLFSNRSGPMERFLLQDDFLAGIEDDPERMKEEGRRLRSLRTNALRLRSVLKIKRKELSEKEAAKSSADDAFIRHVRENRSIQPHLNAQTFPQDATDSYFVAMQTARDEFGPLEDEYTRIEDILDETEFEMARIEVRLYGPEPAPEPGHESDSLSFFPQAADLLGTTSAPGSFLGLSNKYPAQYEPIHAEYLSRLGDLDLARERYQNMTQEHESLLVEQESRLRVGMDLHPNLKMFLDDLPAREAGLQGEITEIELDVERLKSQCLQAGINLDELSEGSEPEMNFQEKPNNPGHI